jgi:hypothetical protein
MAVIYAISDESVYATSDKPMTDDEWVGRYVTPH